MHWLIKAHAMALLSRLPGGKSVYHALQRRLGTNRLNFAESLERTGQIVDLVHETGCDVCGSTCLEIGTGWRPFVPMLFYLAGAERTITLDINPWMDQRYALETYRAIGKGLPQIAERLHVSQSQIESRYVHIDESKLNLANLLAAFHVDYRCPADACATGLPSRLIDFVVSSNVLEHVPPAVLEGMHRESAQILKPGGLAVHRINPGDHYILTDARITGANFLQFPEKRWYWYGGSGLSYHNRLRCVQQKELLAGSGLKIVIERVRSDERADAAIRSGRLKIDPSFQHFTLEQLTADYIWLVGARTAD